MISSFRSLIHSVKSNFRFPNRHHPTSMSNHCNTTTSTPHVVDKIDGHFYLYSDGTVTRTAVPNLASVGANTSPYRNSVTWKDFLYDPTHNLHLRLFKPAAAKNASQLPVIFYIHGGGFCIGSPTWAIFHNYCLRLAAEIPAVVASVSYRLAPEHRIPAAMDDCYTAVDWLMHRADNDVYGWLGDGVADFGKVFIAGDSAGGNITHNLAVRIGGGGGDGAVKVRGFVLMEPGFGGTVRTRSEIEAAKNGSSFLPLVDKSYRVSLPVGETTDHPMLNPFGPRSPNMEGLDLSPVLVMIGSNDLLKDRAAEYVTRLKEMGKKAEYVELPGEGHGFFVFKPDCPAAKQHMVFFKRFVQENSG